MHVSGDVMHSAGELYHRGSRWIAVLYNFVARGANEREREQDAAAGPITSGLAESLSNVSCQKTSALMNAVKPARPAS